jgi:hypothetical protein
LAGWFKESSSSQPRRGVFTELIWFLWDFILVWPNAARSGHGSLTQGTPGNAP